MAKMVHEISNPEGWERIQAQSKKNWGGEPRVDDGVPFVMVGRNASHEFHVGFWNGVFIVKAIDCTWEEGDDYPMDHFSVKHTVEELYNSYLGHL
jgi:hypothetical protein